MATYEKTSLTLPADLFEAVSRAAKAEGRSRSETVAELIRLGLTARKQIDALYRETARLKQTIEDRTARLARAEEQLKTLDPRDFLTGARPGTAKLRDDLACAEKARRQAEADRAEARRAAKQLRRQVEELEGDLEERDEEIASLEEQCAKAAEERDRADARRIETEQALAAEQARKMPWYWRLTLPDIRFHRIDVGYRASAKASWRRGFLACALVFGLGLFVTPHELPPMRYVASAAMGTWGDIPKAAARLHGTEYLGRATQLQVYALLHAAGNEERLAACFERAAKLKPMAKPIPCTIHVPSEFELYADIRMSGPFADTSRVAQRLDERVREGRRLEQMLERAAR